MAIDEHAFEVALAPAITNLRALLDVGREFRMISEVSGSIVASERARQIEYASGWGDHPADASVMMHRLMIQAAEGCLRGVCTSLLQLHDGPMAFYVLARAAYEYMARAIWFGDPGIGLEERIRRGQAERLRSSRELSKLAPPGYDHRGTHAERDAILASAEATGIGTLPSAHGRPRRLLNEPTITAMVGNLLIKGGKSDFGRWAYRHLSVIVHATTDGVLHLVSDESSSDSERVQTFAISSSDATMHTYSLTKSYVGVINAAIVYHGWPLTNWTQQANNVLRFTQRSAQDLMDAHPLQFEESKRSDAAVIDN